MVKKISLTDTDLKKMTEIEVNPSSLLDNFFDYSNVVIQKPWGYEYLIYSNNQTAVWLLYLNPGFQTSMHAHPNKKTSITVLSGEAEVETLNGNHKLRLCQGLLIDKGVFHSTKVISDKGLFVVETETPTNKRDLIRFEDRYGRSGKEYENERFYSKLNKKLHSSFNQKKRYNSDKRFGDCSLTLMKFRDEKHFRKHTQTSKPEILAVLSGRITNNTKCSINTGDVIDHEHLLKQEEFYIPEESEMLLIRKML